MDKNKFTEYTLHQRKGMEGVGDFEMEFLSAEEREVRWEQHRQYIEQCKTDGSYGEEYSLNISIEHDDSFDDSVKKQINPPTSSFSTIIWNEL